MARFSATDRATKCDIPVARSTSHPSAATATVSYCVAMNSATRRVRAECPKLHRECHHRFDVTFLVVRAVDGPLLAKRRRATIAGGVDNEPRG